VLWSAFVPWAEEFVTHLAADVTEHHLVVKLAFMYPDQDEGFSLVDALKELEEELGCGNDDHLTLLRKPEMPIPRPTKSRSRSSSPVRARTTSTWMNQFYGPRGETYHPNFWLPPDNFSNNLPNRSQEIPRGDLLENQRENSLENPPGRLPEHIYEGPWQRSMHQLLRDALVNCTTISKFIRVNLAFLGSSATSFVTSWSIKVYMWLLSAGVFAALIDVVARR
jgi:hypothetical protein